MAVHQDTARACEVGSSQCFWDLSKPCIGRADLEDPIRYAYSTILPSRNVSASNSRQILNIIPCTFAKDVVVRSTLSPFERQRQPSY